MIRRRARTLGLALAHDAVRAVVLERGRIVWACESAVEGDDFATAVRDLATEARRVYGARGAVAVAVGPTRAQLRRLHGLPAVRDADTLAAIVQQNAGRYFRQGSVPMITTPVAERSADTGWAGAIDSTVVDALGEIGRELHVSSIAVAPLAALLGHAAPDSTVAWRDGDVALEATYTDDRLTACRVLPSMLMPGAHGDGAALVAELRTLGDDAIRYADAYAAARGGAASRLAVQPRGERERRNARRLTAASSAFVIGLAFASLAPTLAAMRVQRTASARLARVSVAAAPVQLVERAVSDSARLLARLVSFHGAARSRTLLLATLSCAIEEPAMLLSLRLEPSDGTLTALAPSAADLLAMLDAVPEIASPVIVGTVTPESRPSSAPTTSTPPGASAPAPGEGSLERVTVRFQWRSGVALATHAVGCDK